MLLQDLHDLGEGADGPAQAVHLVDQHAVDLLCLNIGKQAADGGRSILFYVGLKTARQIRTVVERLERDACISEE